MIMSNSRLVNFIRENPLFTVQQAWILRTFGNDAAKCLDCYCFKCTSECDAINGALLPNCSAECKKPISPAKVRRCFKF